MVETQGPNAKGMFEVTFVAELEDLRALHASLVAHYSSLGAGGMDAGEIVDMLGTSAAPNVLQCVRLALDRLPPIPGLSIHDSVAEEQGARAADAAGVQSGSAVEAGSESPEHQGHLQALQNLKLALRQATDCGLFLEMAALVHPDRINHFCDDVDAFELNLLDQSKAVRPERQAP